MVRLDTILNPLRRQYTSDFGENKVGIDTLDTPNADAFETPSETVGLPVYDKLKILSNKVVNKISLGIDHFLNYDYQDDLNSEDGA